jgi:predicted SprT family Zn-dependent metalloprotease
VRKYAHLLDLPPLVIYPSVLHRAYGMSFVSSAGVVVILIEDRTLLEDEFLDRVVLHELAHAECAKRFGSLRHDARWRAVCRRLSAATNLKVT